MKSAGMNTGIQGRSVKRLKYHAKAMAGRHAGNANGAPAEAGAPQ